MRIAVNVKDRDVLRVWTLRTIQQRETYTDSSLPTVLT